MEPKNLNKKHKRIGKSFTNTLTQTKPQNVPMRSYDTVAVIHSKFSSLVSSATVYSIRYSPKKKHATK